MEPLIVLDFPMSPSVNTMLMPVMGAIRRNKAGKIYAAGRMVKSKEHIQYANLCDRWAQRYKKGLTAFKAELNTAKLKRESQGLPFCLEISAYYMFHVERIITANGKVEQKDLDNLLKSALDNLCRILGIDDKHVFRINAEKCSTKGPESVILKISLFQLRDQDQIKDHLNIQRG